VIAIRIDPHKSSLTAVALDPTGQELGQIRLPVTAQLAELGWAQASPGHQWAVEGGTGFGRGVAQLFATAGEQVLDVLAKLAARARLLGSGSARKTDITDAASVAAVTDTHPVACSDTTERADGSHARTAHGVCRYSSQTCPVMTRPSSLSILLGTVIA
jgi:hypothetical protein